MSNSTARPAANDHAGLLLVDARGYLAEGPGGLLTAELAQAVVRSQETFPWAAVLTGLSVLQAHAWLAELVGAPAPVPGHNGPPVSVAGVHGAEWCARDARYVSRDDDIFIGAETLASLVRASEDELRRNSVVVSHQGPVWVLQYGMRPPPMSVHDVARMATQRGFHAEQRVGAIALWPRRHSIDRGITHVLACLPDVRRVTYVGSDPAACEALRRATSQRLPDGIRLVGVRYSHGPELAANTDVTVSEPSGARRFIDKLTAGALAW